ncbi:NAD-dependent epimerase/dehydratase family protein [Arenibacterium sp. LLYu02]|uniref:NAD-dependent epimerase/dehydratase family protein n=1 Tax=Arenibacterium sp. LLYu02 TaxID=3404132 RepID=UPI003B2166BB
MVETTLVTGANGLIGYEVVKRLVAAGRRVVAVDRSITEVASLTPDAHALEIGDTHRLHEIANRYGVDAIVHCGGVSGPMLGRDNPAALFEINVGGTLDVAEVARQRGLLSGTPCRLIFCSSLTVYGSQEQDDIGEATPLLTRQCYASSKVAGEAIALSYAAEHGVDAIVLRIAGVYGPRRRTACVLRQMITDALEGRATDLPFGEGFPRQWVYVDDIIDGILLALEVRAPQMRVFNLSAGENPTIDQAAALIRAALPQARITLAPGADPEDVTLGRLSIAAAARHLGYAPKVTLKSGIQRLIQSIQNDLAGVSSTGTTDEEGDLKT